MPFSERFQLLELKRDEGARTFEAREIATGRPVLIHFFSDTSPWGRALLKEVDALPENERSRVLDRGKHEDGVYLVTDRLVDYPGLREWLSQKNVQRSRPLHAGGAWKVAPPPKPAVDDALSNLFASPPVPSPTGPIPLLTNTGEQTLQIPLPVDLPKAPGAAAPAVEPPPSMADPAPDEPGEFTRQFAPVLRPVPAPAPATPPAAPASQPPGEFTRQFAAPPPKPAAQPSQAPQPAGEFTRLFQRPVPVAPPPRAEPGPPPQSAPQQAGEFTQMLQAQRQVTPAAPPPQPSSEAEFARYFQSPMTPSGPGSSTLVPPPQPLPQPPSQPRGAGEFTQIFGRGDIPSAPAPPAPVAPPSDPGNATQVFATPRTSTAPIPYGGGTPSPGMVPPMAQGPGEYTRQFSAPAPLTFGQASPVSPQTMRQPEPLPLRRNKSRVPLLLMVAAVVLLITALIVFLMIRPRTA